MLVRIQQQQIFSFHDVGGGENISATGDGVLALNSGTSLTITTPTTTIADGTNNFNIASHDGTNGLQLGGTLVTVDANTINGTTGRSIALAIVFSGM